MSAPGPPGAGPTVSVDLRRRDTAVLELMDDPACDEQALRRTYARFRTVNRLVAGWRRTYRALLRPRLSTTRTTTLLDVGFGGGDLARALAGWARADGLRLLVDAVDPDPRALAFVRDQPPTAGVRYRAADTTGLVAEGEQFDLVTSNHLLHHLGPDVLARVLDESRRLGRELVVHSDLRRSRAAYLGWSVAARPAARDSFLHTDGLRSIRRSYTPAELAAVVPDGWVVQPQLPFRLLLTWGAGG
ncbi:2-polyprenyl-3-methyl-5-hydroxy-6-metoxy-1,4-benzoquinol methylase [Friedmanniella luteola]|uniref:2-polyprenyl-3-methyl-5-hydroxy-6-metoxy-1,4-benzoquinol methylase n=1 Tax=Friedmanniella luteola TaxID=546871 RepID=A0A1H1XZS0_9ACTN|nr:methyltransferase domain-containing protein [Friedmanniella luteola]SDT14758.1 2-polyprenyl-3-methyl-5-hydroxy-6-metoxy-1,4-benzoquinol methylase [Friedmanniella luteola]